MGGRMAFKGMNAEIENMMMQDRLSREEIESRKREKDVSDSEMAESYAGLVATIGNKFAKKRDSSGRSTADRREALLEMAGQETNQHTKSLLNQTEDFLAQVRDSQEAGHGQECTRKWNFWQKRR